MSTNLSAKYFQARILKYYLKQLETPLLVFNSLVRDIAIQALRLLNRLTKLHFAVTTIDSVYRDFSSKSNTFMLKFRNILSL